MAGTDAARHAPSCASPAVILVEPQLGENIGMVARAMLNCGLTDLRLVRPRETWPNEKAVAAASGADIVLERARVFSSMADALSDIQLVYATTARTRDMTKRVLSPRTAAREIRERQNSNIKVGLLFGKEAKGLHNDDVALSDAVIIVPLNPGFSSLNLAMAVLIVGYEWHLSGGVTGSEGLRMPRETRPATKSELIGLFEHLESALDDCGFLRVKEKRPIMVRNLRNMLGRAEFTEQEVRTLRGVITCLSSGRQSDGDA